VAVYNVGTFNISERGLWNFVLYVPHWLQEAYKYMSVLLAAVSAVCGIDMSAF